jgi:SRSO17 transposase
MTTLIETAPAMELRPHDIDHVVDEVRAYHASDSPLLQRRAQREWAADSLHGVLLDIPRTSIEPMIVAWRGDEANAIRGMQPCMGAGAWSDQPMLARHWCEVAQTLGDADGVLTLDGSDFLNQGRESVGGTRQYCGAVGPRANCQAGVFVGDASHGGDSVLDRRLSVPQAWREDEAFAKRRHNCGLPPDLSCKTKPQLGWDMMRAVVDHQVLRCRGVTGDEGLGRDGALLAQVASSGLWYCADVPHDTRVWRRRPETAVPQWAGRGRKPTRERLCPGQAAAEEVTAVAASLPSVQWSRQRITEGRNGPLGADCAVSRVVAVRDGLPGPEVCLVRRRHLATGEWKTSVWNAPVSPPCRPWCASVACGGRLRSAVRRGNSLLAWGSMQCVAGGGGIII